MKAILLGICILFATCGFSQTLIINGKVIDKKSGQPIIAANIVLPDGIGTYSGADGSFSIKIDHFPVTLRISHISFGKTDFILQSDPKKQIIIELEELVSEIGEVQVSARKLRILTEKDDFTLQDFAFDKDNLWLLGYLKNQATQSRLWLANWYGDTITSIPVQNPERLYTDFFGNVHLVLRDSVHQVFFGGTDILMPYAYERNGFFETMTPIKAAFGHNLVYQEFLPEQQGLHTYYYSENDQKPYFLSNTRDTAEEVRKVDEHVLGYGMGLLLQAMSTDSSIRWIAIKAIAENKRTKNLVFNRQVQVPVFSFMDKLFLVNLYKDSLNVYDPSGKYIHSIAIDYHKDTVLYNLKYLELSYLIDPVSQRTYILHRTVTSWLLYEFDTNSGCIGARIPLPDFPGMSGIKVYGQAVYFLYPEKKYPYYVRLYRYQL